MTISILVNPISGKAYQTRIGNRELLYARQMLKLRDDAYSRLSSQEIVRPVTLGCPDLYAAFLLPETLARFKAVYPKIEVTVRCALSAQLSKFQRGRSMSRWPHACRTFTQTWQASNYCAMSRWSGSARIRHHVSGRHAPARPIAGRQSLSGLRIASAQQCRPRLARRLHFRKASRAWKPWRLPMRL